MYVAGKHQTKEGNYARRDFFMEAVIKIDLCGSKMHLEQCSGDKNEARTKLLSLLIDKAKLFFPQATDPYPAGSLYSAQGDCIYIVLDKPTVALRSTIEFMKDWFSMVPSLPDCRAIIDYGRITENLQTGRIELIGEPFENISVVEKLFESGQIGVSDSLRNNVDETLVQFIKSRPVVVTAGREIIVWHVNYENPRLIEDSSLVHALFIASPSGDDVRNRAFETLLIECILEKKDNSITVDDAIEWLDSRNCPNPGKQKLLEICKSSEYLIVGEHSLISIEKEKNDSIIASKAVFYKARKVSQELIVTELSKRLEIDIETLLQKINVFSLVEEYLSAIFLEIRFMANYFRSTQSLFEKLMNSNEYDFIIKKYVREVIGEDIEKLNLVKNAFLLSLQGLTKEDNVYIAAVFHNVLMLYYLNRNSRFAHSQLREVTSKRIFIDTNIFYAYRCESSNFYDTVAFTLQKLIKMNAKIIIFDKSLLEFNESMDGALQKYHKSRGISFITGARTPWIWQEYEKKKDAYNKDFDYCVAVHRLPSNYETGKPLDNEKAIKELKGTYGIELQHLEPYLDKDALGELYDDVFQAKRKYNPFTEWFDISAPYDTYHQIVLHDANCLHSIKCEGNGPHDCQSLFVTCDYSLAKIRKRKHNAYNYLITISEFYEFMIPYLFLSDVMVKQPVEMPNFLLAAALSIRLDQAPDFRSLIGNFLSNHLSAKQNYRILSDMEAKKRFTKIKEQEEKIAGLSEKVSDEDIKEYVFDVTSAAEEYESKVKEETARSFISDLYNSTRKELQKVSEEKREIERRVAFLEDKNEKKARMLKKQERRKKKALSQSNSNKKKNKRKRH
jgi:hypothetical protein